MNGTNGTTTKRDVVEFPPNTPIRLAVKYSEPRIGQGKNGPYAMFTTTDDRVMFLTPEEAQAITRVGVKPGEPFNIMLAWSGKRGDPKIYQVWLDRAAEVERAKQEHPGGNYGRQANGTFTVPATPAAPPHIETDLEYELRMSVELERIKADIANRKKQAAADATGKVTPAAARSATASQPQHQPQHHQGQDNTAMNGRGETWDQIVLALGKQLVGMYADVLLWAKDEYSELWDGSSGQLTPEDCRTLLTTAFINTKRGA